MPTIDYDADPPPAWARPDVQVVVAIAFCAVMFLVCVMLGNRFGGEDGVPYLYPGLASLAGLIVCPAVIFAVHGRHGDRRRRADR